MTEHQETAAPQVELAFYVGFDDVGNGSVSVHINGEEALSLSAESATSFGLRMVDSASHANSRASLFRSLTLAGMPTEQAITFIRQL